VPRFEHPAGMEHHDPGTPAAQLMRCATTTVVRLARAPAADQAPNAARELPRRWQRQGPTQPVYRRARLRTVTTRHGRMQGKQRPDTDQMPERSSRMRTCPTGAGSAQVRANEGSLPPR
jgi:hypothetical protein